MAKSLALLAVVMMSAAWVAAQENLPSGSPPAGPAPATGAPGASAEPQQPQTDARHYSYAIGLDIGTSFRGDNLPLDLESLLAGVRDGQSGAAPKFSLELCQAALEQLGQQRLAALERKGKEYLAKNAKAQGVQTTGSGLQYRVIRAGTGPSPTKQDSVQVHYRGSFVDGTVFDESFGGEPAQFRVDEVIEGWSEALQLMKVGDRWQLAIPSNLAYREQGRDAIPPNATLLFDVELLGIVGK